MALLFPFYKWAHWRAGLSHMWPLCSGASHSCVGPAFDFQTSQYVNGSYSQGRFLLGKFVVATGSSRKPTPRDLSFRFYSRFSESIGFENNLGFPQPGSGRRAFTEHWQHLQTEPRRRVSLGSTPRQLLRWKNFAFNWQIAHQWLAVNKLCYVQGLLNTKHSAPNGCNYAYSQFPRAYPCSVVVTVSLHWSGCLSFQLMRFSSF